MPADRWFRNKWVVAACALGAAGAALALLVSQSMYVVDRGGQLYNIMAYGAVLNGSADNSAAIEAAESAANAAGGGTVFFPCGNTGIAVSAMPLPMYSGVNVRGAGKCSVLESLSVPSVDTDMFRGTGISNVRISNLAVEDAAGDTTALLLGFHVLASQYVSIDHCFAQNAALFYSDTSSTTGYAGVTSSNFSSQITVSDNQATAPGSTTGRSAIGLVYTQNAVAQGNIITGYYTGMEIWGGDANANGAITNTRWDQNITISGNVGYDNGVAGSNGGLFWTSMCQGCVETGNVSINSGDIGIDNEGSWSVAVSGNYVYNAYHSAYAQFFYSRDITWSGNTAIMTSGSEECFEVFNGAQNRTPFDLNFSGNNCWNNGTGISQAGTISGSVDNIQISHNNFRNTVINLNSNNMHRAEVIGNEITLTNASSSAVNGITAAGFTGVDANGATLLVADNDIYSDVAQPSGSVGVYISHSDFSYRMNVSVMGNQFGGAAPFPTDVALHESSTNSQAIYAKFENNTFAVPLVTKTIDSGNGSISTYYSGNVSPTLTAYTGP